jgi:hypothetical protein
MCGGAARKLHRVPHAGLRFKQLSLYLDVLRDCYEAFVIYRCAIGQLLVSGAVALTTTTFCMVTALSSI